MMLNLTSHKKSRFVGLITAVFSLFAVSGVSGHQCSDGVLYINNDSGAQLMVSEMSGDPSPFPLDCTPAISEDTPLPQGMITCTVARTENSGSASGYIYVINPAYPSQNETQINFDFTDLGVSCATTSKVFADPNAYHGAGWGGSGHSINAEINNYLQGDD